MTTANDNIGSRLRSAREARGISLRKVAQEVGVSASMLSQVETGKSQPSVATLYSLANVLAISVDQLLGLEPEPPSVETRTARLDLQRGAENPAIEMENGVRWERLAMGQRGPADALLVTYQPGASSSVEGKLMRHAGQEYAYLLSGEITLQIDFEEHVLRAGDSVHFDSSRPHMFSNRGSDPATGVWFVVGRRDQATQKIERNVPPPRAVRSAVEVLHRLDSFD
ncbi:cupin domain-containing protein [Microbacterium caowuchunii]|uniref:cupin domain-containing protein n=1 Tax=Microbacterium caowuchunii TaxID=2614638 RepID=UPI001247AD89|nr:cupin domain-containing protein [Microbacterium caowuchunii]QEV98798.1 cupin domain-containing protein [Microbacterium caowuchunii]